ncbi:hypothetical protein RUM43_014719 [Polyplax serrata]|uniref:Uncharacterized protein n=1 Tax=Polyplax serrata TaxID=468196 RepID=A0AAN8NIA2_POLSC
MNVIAIKRTGRNGPNLEIKKEGQIREAKGKKSKAKSVARREQEQVEVKNLKWKLPKSRRAKNSYVENSLFPAETYRNFYGNWKIPHGQKKRNKELDADQSSWPNT